MSRTLLALGMALLAAHAVRADGLPPKGAKRVVADHKITTEKEFPDYAFYTVIGKGVVTAVKLDPKTPVEIPGAARGAGIGRNGYLVAVPKGAEKAYGSEKEFHAAIGAGKVEGQVRSKARLDSADTIKDTDKRDTITHEHKVEKVDKDGIVLSTKRDVAAPEKKDSPDAEDGVTAYTPRGGVWVAGAASFAALTLGGLWAVGRSRRKA